MMRAAAVLLLLFARGARSAPPLPEVIVGGRPIEILNDSDANIGDVVNFDLRHATAPRPGDLTEDVVWPIFRDDEGIRHCYQRGLASDPKLEGRIVLRAIVDKAGKVTLAQLDQPGLPPPGLKGRAPQEGKPPPDSRDLTDTAVIDCVLARTRALAFPKRPAGRSTLIRYTFFFRPQR